MSSDYNHRNADGEIQEVTRGNIRLARARGGCFSIRTGAVGDLGDGLEVFIAPVDLDDAIAALQALRPAPEARYAPVAVPPDALAAAERNPDIVRKIEESNERVIARLKERLPPRTVTDACPVPGGCDNPHCRPVPTFAGRFRVYFNRHGAAPLVWCVATDAWELAVAAVSIRTAAGTCYQPKAVPDSEDGKPSAWIAVSGLLTLRGSEAIITGADAPEVQEP